MSLLTQSSSSDFTLYKYYKSISSSSSFFLYVCVVSFAGTKRELDRERNIPLKNTHILHFTNCMFRIRCAVCFVFPTPFCLTSGCPNVNSAHTQKKNMNNKIRHMRTLAERKPETRQKLMKILSVCSGGAAKNNAACDAQYCLSCLCFRGRVFSLIYSNYNRVQYKCVLVCLFVWVCLVQVYVNV